MLSEFFTVPYFKNTLKEIEKILLSLGLIRWAVIKGNNLETHGEAGIGFFYITLEDETTIKIDARNRQALEIISNLILVELNDLKEKMQEESPVSEKTSDLEKESEMKLSCAKCQLPLEYLGEKQLAEDLPAKVFLCPECKKLEFFMASLEDEHL